MSCPVYTARNKINALLGQEEELTEETPCCHGFCFAIRYSFFSIRPDRRSLVLLSTYTQGIPELR